MRKLVVTCLGMLLLAPLAQAQFIDCSGGCTETLYGLGNDPPEGPFLHTTGIGRTGPPDGSCGPEFENRFQGQIRLRERDSCVVSATTRCPLEIPLIAEDSGFFNLNRREFDVVPVGIFVALGAVFSDVGGNLGHRQLSGTCTLDAGEECALDGDCPSAAGCRSTCHSSPGTPCTSHADCPAADCRTEIEWDGIGLCTDDATVCISDADCPGEHVCFDGFELTDSPSQCLCCHSALGTLCPTLFGLVEYPALLCGTFAPPQNLVASPDWLFEGGRETPFEYETIQVPGQQEGLCSENRSRPCGALGDFWTGAANGKCQGEPPCPDPFDPVNGALASPCDDVAFGGIEGDFCQLSEKSIRGSGIGINPDGTQDPTSCAWVAIRMVGTPGELCALPLDIPEGDPQPGCRLFNIGVAPQPDLDCSGTDDTEEGRCTPEGGAICSEAAQCPPCTSDADCGSGNCINQGDLCPFIGELNWFLDSNNDDIGDECQCGDGNGDGFINALDIGVTAQCANGVVACDSTLVDTDANNATNALDIGGVAQVANGLVAGTSLRCVRNIDTTAGGG